MKRFLEHKGSVILLAVIGLIALVLLSVALRDLSFRPPEPFSFNFNGVYGSVNPGPGMQIPPWKFFLFSGLLLLILAVIMFFLDEELRKRILIRLLRFGLALAMIWFIATYIFDPSAFRQMFRLPSLAGAPDAATAARAGAPVFTLPQINPWLVFAVSFAIGLGLVLVAWFTYTRRLKFRERLMREEVADIATDALTQLETGRNWDDAIVQAYMRMNEVVVAARGLVRQPGSTPTEFAQRMERIGLPGEAVRTLTGLFEGVRYGSKVSSPAERDLAAAALNAILHYCERSERKP
jgi:hypothetical protein